MALVIAKKSGAHITFLHLFREQFVVSAVPHSGHYDPIAGAEEIRINKNFAKLMMLAEKLELGATPVLVRNNGMEKITDYIASNRADLIVMGSRGVSGIKEMFMGSNAQHVVRHASVPVLVIKKIPDNLEIRNILFASTFSRDMTRPLSKVVGFGKLWNACINLLFVNLNTSTVEDRQEKETMARLTCKFPGTTFTTNRMDTDDMEWGISQFVQTSSSDLIATSKKDHSGSFEIFSQNIAESLVKHEGVPVMVV